MKYDADVLGGEQAIAIYKTIIWHFSSECVENKLYFLTEKLIKGGFLLCFAFVIYLNA